MMSFEDLVTKLELEKNPIVCKENKKRVEFSVNDQEFYKIHLDDNDLLPNEQTSCDYIVVYKNLKDVAIWIELKGRHISDACEQIKCSIKNYGEKIKNKYAVIVYNSKASPKTNDKFHRLRRGLGKNLLHGSDTVKIKYDGGKVIKTN